MVGLVAQNILDSPVETDQGSFFAHFFQNLSDHAMPDFPRPAVLKARRLRVRGTLPPTYGTPGRRINAGAEQTNRMPCPVAVSFQQDVNPKEVNGYFEPA